MIRKLLIVFASGLVLSILLLSAAWVIGGNELVARVKEEHGRWRFDHHGEHHGPMTVRTLAFDSGRVLTVDAPVNLRFTRGPETQMTVEGPDRIIRRLRWKDGRLSLNGHGPWFNGPLDVTITAPALPGLVLHGASDVELIALDQPALSIDAHGAVDLEASGKVGKLYVTSHGAGDLDLADVDTGDATLEVAGVGDLDISAIGNVQASISGAGDITLHRKPGMLTSKISGFGSINHDY